MCSAPTYVCFGPIADIGDDHKRSGSDARREFIVLLDGTAALPLVGCPGVATSASIAREANAQQIAQMKAICN
jgi:hypothetical protein